MSDPVNSIQWRAAVCLKANDYNPNAVFTPELKLLELSILRTGWTQPILILEDGTIIDGFHRWSLSLKSEKLLERYSGTVPCAVIDVPRSEAILLTVRMNRAKGTHQAVRMSSLVRELIDVHGLDPGQIAPELGATRAEIDLLYQNDLYKARDLKNAPFSQAWVPRETRGEPEEVAKREAREQRVREQVNE